MTETFDESPLQEFIKDKEVLSVENHFFIKNDSPYLAVIINYKPLPMAQSINQATSSKSGKRDEAWRELIDEKDVPLFNTLRIWRAERSKKEGLPSYIICNNQHLADIVNARPQTLAALGRIQGFGNAKLEKYGQDILALLLQSTSINEEKKNESDNVKSSSENETQEKAQT
jgi:ATP-dependent DNA helicase RecQ